MIFDSNNVSFLRDVIGNYMVELGKKDKRVAVVNADLMGTCRNKSFVEFFPERAFNVGIAEQNMISFSAGLAHEGFIPYAFSMAPFISLRACEQCRTDVAYGNLNVRLMATYSGCSGGISGATHWAIEDCAIMNSIPNMTVIEPCDETSALALLKKTLDYNGPIYFRTSIAPAMKIYEEGSSFEIGKANIIIDGNDGAFICSGNVVQNAVIASEIIRKKTGMNIRVLDVSTIKPIDTEKVISAAKTGYVIVAQDHTVMGGLGSVVAKTILENGVQPVKFKIVGINDDFDTMAHLDYLYKKYGLDSEGLADEMMALLMKG